MAKHVNSLILHTYQICELLTHCYPSLLLVAWQHAYTCTCMFGKPINKIEKMKC